MKIILKWLGIKAQNMQNVQGNLSSNGCNNRRETKHRIAFRYFYRYLILGIAAFLLVVISGLAVHHYGWGVREVANVHYMDSVGPNLLFRGGLPQTGNPPVFNYQGLQRAMMNAGEKSRDQRSHPLFI